MPRDSSGSHSLPAGNPVTTGSTISSTWANNTLADISSEITDSLSRLGNGAMQAPLHLDNGTVAAPAVAFESDDDTGLYRVGANNPAIAAGGNQIQAWTTAGTTITGTATVSGALTAQSTVAATGAVTAAAGVTVTQSTANAAAVTATGNGTNHGVVATGGGTSGQGVQGTGGAPNGVGVAGYGAGSGTGVAGTGGATGYGVTGIGGGTAVGGRFTCGTAATAAVPQDALSVTNGNISLNGVTYPNSDVGFQNKLTPLNLVKAWAVVTTSGGGAATVTEGFNITGASISGNYVRITFAHAFSTNNYCVVASAGTGVAAAYSAVTRLSTHCEVTAFVPGTGAEVNHGTSVRVVSIICLGTN